MTTRAHRTGRPGLDELLARHHERVQRDDRPARQPATHATEADLLDEIGGYRTFTPPEEDEPVAIDPQIAADAEARRQARRAHYAAMYPRVQS